MGGGERGDQGVFEGMDETLIIIIMNYYSPSPNELSGS